MAGQFRIGVYRACGIGDAIQLTPLFQQIRADFPEAEIVFFTSDNVAELISGHPALDRVVTFPARWTIGPASRFGNLPLWFRLRRKGPWDLFLNFEPRSRASLFFPLVGARQSTGFITRRRAIPIYTHPVHTAAVAAPDGPHISSYYLDAWRRLTGKTDRGFRYDARHLLRQSVELPDLPTEYLCLAPGSGNFAGVVEIKRWPYWRELADGLRAEGWSIAWLGGPDDARQHTPPISDLDLLGRINLVAAAQVLSRSAGMVGNDSGMFHLAIALGVPAAAFYGPTRSTHVGPFRAARALVLQKALPCVPCQELVCRAPASLAPTGTARPFCMTLQTAADVLPALREFFGVPPPIPAS